MEEKLLSKCTKDVLFKLLESFNISKEVKLIGTHQSYVYKGILNEKNVYVRITLSTHRTLSQLQGEIDMILYLHKNNFDLATPIMSKTNNYIETYSTNEYDFHAVVFKEAEGLGVGVYPWSINVPKRVGVMNAKLHDLLSTYKPKEILRPKWYENTFIVKAKEYLPNNHEKLLKVLDDLVTEIKTLKKDIKSYGLTHNDMVACNYNMTDDKTTLFDFDEASYNYFINDIAVNLFYDALGWKGTVNVEDAIKAFESFIRGYKSIRDLDEYWISKIDLFMRLREIVLYVAIHRSKDINNLDRWSKNYMEGRKERIESCLAFIDVDLLESKEGVIK